MMTYLNLGAWRRDTFSGAGRSLGRIYAIVALWSLVVAVGLCVFWRYAAAPGDGGSPPAHWPAQSKIARDGRPTLLVFAHPLCPCTRATLAELERLVASCRDQFDAHVLFIAPEGTDSSWQNTELVRIARRIPHVTVHVDAGRGETDLFQERTSGACLVYDTNGRLLFNGGLTAARGHEGDNPGTDAIRALMARQGEPSATPVFGCPLFEGHDRSPEPKPDSESHS
jgi:hypothetical protein